MREKTARRFINRNSWNIKYKTESPSFFRRYDKCLDVLEQVKYKRLSPLERVFKMVMSCFH